MSVASIAGYLFGLNQSIQSPAPPPITLVSGVSTQISTGIEIPVNTTYLFQITITITGDNTTDVDSCVIFGQNEVGALAPLGYALYNQTMNTTPYIYQCIGYGNGFNEGSNEFSVWSNCVFTGTAPTISASVIAFQLS